IKCYFAFCLRRVTTVVLSVRIAGGREGVTGMLKSLASAAAIVVLLQTPVLAGQGADITRSALYEGTFGAGRASLQPLAEGGDQEARFGLGLITFVEAVE